VSHHDELIGKIEHILKDSQSKHQTIKRLYQLVRNDSVAGGYQQYATQEQRSADRWRLTSLAFIVTTVGWLLAAIFTHLTIDEGGEVLFSAVALTASLTGVLLLGAGYSARQSNRHRSNEISTKRFALEVNAIDPFINSLDENTQNDLKRQFSEKLFGNSSIAPETAASGSWDSIVENFC